MLSSALRVSILLLRPLSLQRVAAFALNPSSFQSLSIRNMASDDTPDKASVRKQKQELRHEIRTKLRAMTKEQIKEESQKVWDKLFQLQPYQAAKSIGLFLSMPSGEIDTDPVLLDALQKGKQIYVPQVGRDFEQYDMDMIRVVVTAEDDNKMFHHSWPRNKWGIPEPPPSMKLEIAKPGELDLIVVPGVAFDYHGNRLGQGKGYYDRFIARMTRDAELPEPVLIAVGLDCQLIDRDIPMDHHDKEMDMILTPSQPILRTHVSEK